MSNYDMVYTRKKHSNRRIRANVSEQVARGAKQLTASKWLKEQRAKERSYCKRCVERGAARPRYTVSDSEYCIGCLAFMRKDNPT